MTNKQNPTPDEIREARRNAGLSTSEAAGLIHCSRRSWEHWEAGRRMHPAFWELLQRKLAEL